MGNEVAQGLDRVVYRLNRVFYKELGVGIDCVQTNKIQSGDGAEIQVPYQYLLFEARVQ